jgi:ubiquinone/menaquinone biosynthesis C-methylase UbiE
MTTCLSSIQAATYDLEGTSQKDAGIAMIGRLDIEKGSFILDLGCGTGALTKILAEKVGAEGKVVAVDPDGERLKVAREKYSASNIEYIQANDKTFPIAQYNLVFCNATIHWVSDKSGLFQRVYDCLCPGGQFAFTTPDGILPIPAIGKKLFDELLGPEFLFRMHNEVKTYLTADAYKSMASSVGFEITSVTTENLRPQWRNLDHYITAMHGWFGGEFDPAQFDTDTL